MGGGISASQQNLANTSATQAAQAATLNQEGQSLVQQGQADQNPLQNFLKGIIGGDSTATNQAIAPVIGNITKQTNATRENIYDTTAPGAGRDVLLGQNLQNQGSQVASATNSAFLSAFPELAQLGATNTSAGLGLTGASISSLGNSATTSGTVLNSQVQQKAQSTQLLGSLASTAGDIATGGVSGASKAATQAAGGGGGIPSYGQAGIE